jgi:hypothetical protein
MWAGGGMTGSQLTVGIPNGKTTKLLKPLYDVPGHDRLVILCPRCANTNEVCVNDLVAHMKQASAPH